MNYLGFLLGWSWNRFQKIRMFSSEGSVFSVCQAVFPVLLAHLGAAAAGKWKPAKLH